MYSFYGGKQGRTYHIVERFDLLYINYNDNQSYPPIDANSKYSPGDIIKNEVGDKIYRVLPVSNPDEGTGYEPRSINLSTDPDIVQLKGMVNEFQKGGAYTDVNYGQYVIIDSILNLHHKSDDTNGLLYRRGFDYTQAAASTERPDKTKPKYWNNGIFLEEKWLADWDKYVMNPGGGAIYVGQIVGPQGDSPRLVLEPLSTFSSHEHFLQPSTGSLDNTPGAIISGTNITFNDTIKYGSALTADADSNIDGAHITFDIPYPVFDIDAVSVNPYNFSTDLSTAAQSTDEYRPQHYGAGVENPVQWRPNNGNNSLIHEFQYTSTSHPYFHDLQIAVPVGKRGTGIENVSTAQNEDDHYYYLQYQTVDYSNTATGDVSQSIDIAPYNIISSMSLNPGTRKVIPWSTVENGGTAGYNFKRGDLYHFSNYYGVCIEEGMISTSDLRMAADQGVGIGQTYSHILTQEEREAGIQAGATLYMIQDLPPAAPGSLTTSYTASPATSFNFNAPDYLYMTPSKNLYLAYTNSTEDYNLGQIKEVQDITYHTGINEEDHNVEINYNTSNIGQVFKQHNMVVAIDRHGDDLIVLYSDKAVRMEFLTNSQAYEEGKDYFIKELTPQDYYKYNIFASYTQEQLDGWIAAGAYDTITGKFIRMPDVFGDKGIATGDSTDPIVPGLVWVNLGAMGSQYHVLGNYTKQQVIDYIPNGFEDTDARAEKNTIQGGFSNRGGWIISVSDGSNKALYAYNYAGVKWDEEGSHYTDGNDEDYIQGVASSASLNPGSTVHTLWYKLKDLDASQVEPKYVVDINISNATDSLLNKDGICFITSTMHGH